MPDVQQELRTDVLTGRQVLLAAGRRQRPVRVAQSSGSERQPSEEYDPFHEGNEHETPDERLALRKSGSSPNQQDWLLRIVPNKYPAVNESEPTSASSGAYGIHDVVIECPDTRHHLTDLSVAELARVLFAWQTRIRQIATDGRLQSTAVFRNEGSGAGASLPHCHSQILATAFQNTQLKQRVIQARSFTENPVNKHVSLFASWLALELDAETRIIDSSKSFVTVCPWASRVDWHTRFVPNGTAPVFQELSTQDIADLAQRVHSIASAVKNLVGHVDQNLNLILPPNSEPNLFPWMLDFLPRQNRFAGFEMLTDTDILTLTPETAAERLRQYSIKTTTTIDVEQALQPDGYEWVSSSLT